MIGVLNARRFGRGQDRLVDESNAFLEPLGCLRAALLGRCPKPLQDGCPVRFQCVHKVPVFDLFGLDGRQPLFDQQVDGGIQDLVIVGNFRVEPQLVLGQVAAGQIDSGRVDGQRLGLGLDLLSFLLQ